MQASPLPLEFVQEVAWKTELSPGGEMVLPFCMACTFYLGCGVVWAKLL